MFAVWLAMFGTALAQDARESEAPVATTPPPAWHQRNIERAMSRFLNRSALIDTSMTSGERAADNKKTSSQGGDNTPAPMQLGFSSSDSPANIYFNAWGRVAGLRYEDRRDGQSDGDAQAAAIGIDLLPNEIFLVGVTARFDKMSTDSRVSGLAADSNGWMVGPYASLRLPANIFLDGRVTWGRANHDADLPGNSTADFVTNRTHATLRASTELKSGQFSLRPSAQLNHVWQRQQSYSDSNGIFVAEQSMTFGRVTFGSDVIYEFQLSQGGSLEAYVGLHGIWIYETAGEQIAVANVFSEDPWQGRVEVGTTYNAANGLALRGVAAYEGLGVSDFDVLQGSLSLIVPLN
ncbi:MAG: autotransporter outer membrane beta-barrel domain-containing protein [Pseudomonadota bacterium]